jgi:tRNA-(ms[2]io[6]A)-hydroxylase
MNYSALAEKYAQEELSDRITVFFDIEQQAITDPDPLFRFHSGVPCG